MAQQIGYDDTPILPGTKWHVHDGNRPQPPVVTPGDPSTQEAPGAPPSDAVILFDGTDLSGWESRDGGAAGWKVEDGYMEVVPGSGPIRSKVQFGDCHLHVEFRSPEEIKGEGQGRGNSGVFLMGRYEIQVLDCYWNVYDIIWEAPRFDGDELVRPAYVTVILNGIVLHHHRELRGVTAHKVVTEYEPHGTEGPLELQDHGDLVRFRNIWYRPLVGYDED